MKAIDLDTLVPAWIELQRTPHDTPRNDELFWSFDVVYDLVSSHPDQAYDVILAILRADQSNITYENLAAGPLEDLLVYHGPAFIDRIEQEAAINPDFRHLLGGVWQNSMADAVWNRVQACRSRKGWDGIPHDTAA